MLTILFQRDTSMIFDRRRISALSCVLWLSLLQVHAQEIPSIACPNNFEYLRYGDEYIARITVPNVEHGKTRLDVQLTQRESVTSNYYGHLSLFQDQQSTLNNINNGLPVSYRMDFPIPNVLPKLLRISLNGVAICASTDGSLGTVFSLQHELETPVQAFSAISNSNPFPPPNIFTEYITPSPVASANPEKTPASYSQETSTNPAASPPSSNSTQCGISSVQQSVKATKLIAYSAVIDRGEYPWLAAIYKRNRESLRFQCAGSLVSARSVISAAHCFKIEALTSSQITIHLGRHDLVDYAENGVEIRDVAKLITHPEYDPKVTSSSDADLAVLQFTIPVSFSEYIQPICLWKGASDISLIVGEMGFVAGWGSNARFDDLATLPRVVSGKIISNEDCVRSSAVYSHLTSPRTICGGNRDGYGPCVGDSGSGLMLNRDGVWMLRGVLSAGQRKNGRCNLEEYVVYCDLAKHSPWILANII